MEKLKKLAKSKLILAAILFFGTFTFYTLPYKNWKLFDDDFVVLYAADSAKTWSDVKDFFSSNPNNRTLYPSNYKDDVKISFFGVMYRPIVQLLHTLEVCFVAPLNARAHFFISMFMYSINIPLLFYVFTLFFPISYSFCGALIFAFYPSMGWIGRVAVQPYFLVFFLLSISVILLKKSVDEKRKMIAILSALPFFIAIFTQEIVFLYPLWLAIILPLYLSKTMKKDCFGIENLKKSFLFLIPFILAFLFYFGARLYTYPISGGSEGLLFEPGQMLSRLGTRIFDFATLFVDALGLTWISAGNRLRKGIALLSVVFSLLWLFVRSEKKITVLLLASGFVCMSWLSFVMTHQLRYIYLGIPFIIAGVLTMIFYFEGPGKKHIERAAIIYALFMVIVGGKSNYNYLKAFERRSYACDIAYKKFIKEVDPKTSPVCFVGLPQEWFPTEGMAQAVWLHRGNSDTPVYHDWLMNVRCYQTPTLLDISTLPKETILDVTINGPLVTVKSRDPENLWIRYKTPFGNLIPCTMGKFTPLVVDGCKAIEVEIEIDERWYSDDLKFVTWDFEKGELKILEQGE
jgi:hypothetical protein